MGSGDLPAGLGVRWLTAFLDVPGDRVEAAVGFWQTVTRSGLSAWRGGAVPRFATLLPPGGGPYLRVQRLDDGPARVHLDLHVGDVDAAADRALDLGARDVRAEPGLRVMASPGGLPFCVVRSEGDDEPGVPEPVTLPGAGRSRVNQVCLDLPASRHAAETAFWLEVFGGEVVTASRPEFTILRPSARLPLRLLLQRLDDDSGPVSAHLDVMGEDLVGLAAAHAALGAAVDSPVGSAHPWWQVMRDPAGLPYCLIGRDPVTLAPATLPGGVR